MDVYEQPNEFVEIDFASVRPTRSPELKHTIRKMIRAAIKKQNSQTLFTCRDCCFYQPEVIAENILHTLDEVGLNEDDLEPEESVSEHCTFEPTNRLILSKRMPTHLPSCFTFDPLSSPFATVLTLMYSLGVDTMNAKHGWATVVGRLAARQNRFGYLTGITQKNLEKYGTTA
jgi:hypothetical protein